MELTDYLTQVVYKELDNAHGTDRTLQRPEDDDCRPAEDGSQSDAFDDQEEAKAQPPGGAAS